MNPKRSASHGTWDAVSRLTKRLAFLLAFMLSLAPEVTAEWQQKGDSLTYAQKAVFGSVLGNGLLYSFNWDQRWHLGGSRWMSLSAGVTFRPGGEEPTNFPAFSLPLQWNWFRGFIHHREHGAGLTFGSGWYTGTSVDNDPVASQGIYLFAKPIGYRYQRSENGLFLRFNLLAWARIVEFNDSYVDAYGYWETPPIFPWIGLDIGYSFGAKREP